MNRINLFRTANIRSTPATPDSVAWGKTNFDKNTSTLVFAAALIICSVAVGCSSEKPKTESSTNQPVDDSAHAAAAAPAHRCNATPQPRPPRSRSTRRKLSARRQRP